MTIHYKCRKKGYCRYQTVKGRCQVGSHPEGKKCPHVRVVGLNDGFKPFTIKLPRRSGSDRLDPTTDLPWWIPVVVIEELQKQGERGDAHEP